MNDVRQMLDADVLTLGMAADAARREHHGRVVTYLRVHVVSAADLAGLEAVPEAASEVRLYGTPATLDEAATQVRALRAAAGRRRVSAFSLADVQERRWGSLPEVLRRLAAEGLDDVAELPADRVDDLAGSLDALSAAGMSPRRITVAAPHGEERLPLLERVRQALAGHRAVCRFAPLPRTAPVDKPTTGYDDVRTIALARLALGPVSIEVDWTLYGPKLAQVALTFGADHIDAVAAVTDTSLGPRRSTVEDVERNIRAAGFDPQESRADA